MMFNDRNDPEMVVWASLPKLPTPGMYGVVEISISSPSFIASPLSTTSPLTFTSGTTSMRFAGSDEGNCDTSVMLPSRQKGSRQKARQKGSTQKGSGDTYTSCFLNDSIDLRL